MGWGPDSLKKSNLENSSKRASNPSPTPGKYNYSSHTPNTPPIPPPGSADA